MNTILLAFALSFGLQAQVLPHPQSGHPIVTNAFETTGEATPSRVPPIADCMGLKVSDGTHVVRIQIESKCNAPVAVLTNPTEIRVASDASVSFGYEQLRCDVYARIYLIAGGQAVKRSFSPADDVGLTVLGPPDYLVLPPKGRKVVLVPKASPLFSGVPDGEYQAFLVTLAAWSSPNSDRAPSSEQSALGAPFQVRVKEFNQRRGGTQSFKRAQAEWVSSPTAMISFNRVGAEK